jgi:hypothetical protein
MVHMVILRTRLNRDDQEAIRFIGSMLDVTDLKKAEEEFKNAKKDGGNS